MIKNWETCPKSYLLDPLNPKLRHTWCPKPYRIMRFEEGQEPFDPTDPEAYCKECKEPEPEKKYCTVSGLIANPYCPEVTLEPPLPTEVCAVHRKPPTKKRLDPAYIYNPGDPKSIPFGNVFAKCALINILEYPEEKFFDFIDWIAERNDANRMRVFFHGQWGEKTFKLVNLPHPYENGKFDLNRIDMFWWDTGLRRLNYMIEAGIFPTILNHYLINHKGTHWTHPSMNNGFLGQELYGDRDYGVWQFVHYADAEPEDIQEYMLPEGNPKKIDRATALKWIAQYGGNRDYDEWFEDWTLGGLKKEFGTRFGVDHNEIPAGGTYHGVKKKTYNRFGIGPRRRFTSAPLDWKCMGKLDGYMYEAHGIKDVESTKKSAGYFDVRNMLLGHGYEDPFTACPDGFGDQSYRDEGMTLEEAEKRYRELLVEISLDENYFFGNTWHLNEPGVPNDFEKLKQRLDVPNRILRAWYEDRMGL